MYIRNRSGPNTEPYGTPHEIREGSEIVPLIVVV